MRIGRRNVLIAAVLLVALAAAVAVGLRTDLDDADEAGVRAGIFPDYTDVTVPPNIAPLNFIIEEPGDRFAARLLDARGRLLSEVLSRDERIRLPVRDWRQALQEARGEEIFVETFARNGRGGWRRFEPFRIGVAPEPVDDYLIYRRIHTVYNVGGDMPICQRRLSSFRETELFNNRNDGSCNNCHTMSAGHDSHMLLQIRHPHHGPSLLIATEKGVKNVDARSDERPHTPTYLSWHPDGELVAFSQNLIQQFFHTGGRDEPRHAVDMGGNLAVLRVGDGAVFTGAQSARPDRLNAFPQWSPDGEHLYFSSAVPPWDRPPDDVWQGYHHWPNIHYDLVRVPFDPETMDFGEVEVLLSHEETGLSMTQARPSPCGRRVVFVAHDYGGFPIFQESADLWMLDIASGRARPMDEINSNAADTWPNWSANGRWLVFSSKRKARTLSRPYFTYIDDEGRGRKPMVLPQADPAFYRYDYETFNLPELSPHPAPIDQSDLDGIIDAVTKPTPHPSGPAGPEHH